MTLKAAIDALRHDATVWDEVGSTTSGAGTAAAGLGLTETDMSFGAGQTGLVATYNALKDRVAHLLTDGGRVQQKLAVTLDQVASTYEASDERAANKFEGVWVVK